MTSIEKYLNKIVDYMIRHSKDGELPFDNKIMSVRMYLNNEFGLTDDEVEYVWYRYKFLMGWVGGHDVLQYFLKKILKDY